jgi:hypothetical protein
VELLVGEGDGSFRTHCVCPHEGNCLQKVITGCRFGHGLRNKFVVSCSKSKHQRSSAVPRSLAPSIGALFLVRLRCSQLCSGRRNGGLSSYSLRVLFPAIAGSPSAPTDVRLYERGGVLYASGTAGVTRRSEPQMQRTLMFLQNSPATVAASASLWGEATVVPPACVI